MLLVVHVFLELCGYMFEQAYRDVASYRFYRHSSLGRVFGAKDTEIPRPRHRFWPAI